MRLYAAGARHACKKVAHLQPRQRSAPTEPQGQGRVRTEVHGHKIPASENPARASNQEPVVCCQPAHASMHAHVCINITWGHV